jgi:hypothetical protein
MPVSRIASAILTEIGSGPSLAAWAERGRGSQAERLPSARLQSAGSLAQLLLSLPNLPAIGFMHTGAQRGIRMPSQQAIDSADHEGHVSLDELDVLAALLAQVLALKQVGHDGADPLAAALLRAGCLVLDPSRDMLGKIGLDGNVAWRLRLHRCGARHALRKAGLF